MERRVASTGEEEKQTQGVIHKFLSIFAEVRPREVFSVLVLTLNVFLLLSAYYLLKVVREPLILAGGGFHIGGRQFDVDGPDVKAYTAAGQAILLIGVVRIYGALAKRFGRMQLTTALALFFASNLVIFSLLARMHVPLGVPFFLWVGCFSLTVIAQFWSFANDVYTPEQGKRLFAIIGVGSSVGALVGAQIAKAIYSVIGPYNIMLVAAGVLLAGLGLTYGVHRYELEHRPEGASRSDAPPGGARGGFSIILRDRYLLLIAALTLTLNWVNSTGEYLLDRTLFESSTQTLDARADAGPAASDEAPLAVGAPVYFADTDQSRVLAGKVAAVQGDAFDVEAGDKVFKGARKSVVQPRTEKGKASAREQVIGAFKGDFFFWVNAVGVFVQLFVVSRIFKYLGARFALFILPTIALFGYASLAFLPVLAIVRIAKIAENSTDYSVQNTVRQALFLPVSREAKFSAKAAIDTFMVRAGDVLAAMSVFVGKVLALSTSRIAMINLVLVVVWLGIVTGIAREHRRRAPDDEAAEPTGEKAAA
jgi:ATP:ADP antiporter, AAA family